MGKKYDAYEKAAQAVKQSMNRLSNADASGDGKAARQAASDLEQNDMIANATWREFIEDPKG